MSDGFFWEPTEEDLAGDRATMASLSESDRLAFRGFLRFHYGMVIARDPEFSYIAEDDIAEIAGMVADRYLFDAEWSDDEFRHSVHECARVVRSNSVNH